jgi:hypothetical protein
MQSGLTLPVNEVFDELPTLIDLLVMTLENSKITKFSQKKDFS